MTGDRPDGWGLRPFPKTLPDDHPLLISTHTINTPEREELRRQIVDDHLAGAPPTEGRAPVLYLMGGGGASGKGTLKRELIRRGEIPADGVVKLDPDEIKEKFPEYNKIVDAGDSRAAEAVHEESSVVSKRVLSEAMDQRRDVVYDATLGNPDKGRALIDNAKSAGYEVRLYGVTADPAVAVERNGERAERTFRYVPVESQLQAHKGFSEGFESYAARSDTAKLYDTNEPDARLIAAKEPGGELEIIREEEYRAFEQKATLNPAARGPDELYGDVSRAREPETGPTSQVSESVTAEEPERGHVERQRPESQQGEVAETVRAQQEESAQPGPEREQPEREQAASAQDETTATEPAEHAEDARHEALETTQPETARPETTQPERDLPETSQSGSDLPETIQPETPDSGSTETADRRTEVETEQTQPTQPETVETDTDSPQHTPAEAATGGFDANEQDYLSRVDDSMSDGGPDSGNSGDTGDYGVGSASAESGAGDDGGAESTDMSVGDSGRGAE